MKTRLISTSFYASERVLSLSSSGRWLFMYFLTCPYIELTGAFKLAQSKILFETGLTEKAYIQAKTELQEKQLVFFIEQWIVIPGTEEKTGFNKGKTTGKGYAKEYSNLPQEIKDVLINESVYPIENSDTTIAKSDSHINHKTEIRKEGGVGETKKPDPVRAVAEHLISVFNQEFEKKYTLTPKRMKLISERRKTFTDEQLEQSIRGLAKDPWFRGNNDRGWEAGPDYLFREDENVDKGLNVRLKHSSNDLMSIDEVLELRRENGAVN